MKICGIGKADSIHVQRWAKEFVARGHKVFLISHVNVRIDGVDVYSLPYKSVSGFLGRFLHLWRQYFCGARVKKILKKIQPDIIHLHTLQYPAYLGIFSSFHPLVLGGWDGDIIWMTRQKWWYRYFVRYSLKKIDFIIANAELMKKECVRLGFSPDKVEPIICPGVNLRLFKPQPKNENLLKKLNILSDSLVVFSPRSLGQIYNIDTIVRAIPNVLKEIPTAIFVFIWANGELLYDLEHLVKTLNVADRVRFAGKIESHEQVPQYFNIADIVVSVPSCDSMPVSVWEGMACGVAPIVSDLGAVTDYIKDGYNGLVVPQRQPHVLAEKIINLLKDEEKKKLFVQRNLELVREKADMNKNMRIMEQIYSSLIDKFKNRAVR